MSPTHIEEVISIAAAKLPSNIRIISYPILRTKIEHTKNYIHVYGYFILTEINEFVLLKTTPIPLNITQGSYWILNIPNEILAVDYNSQLYFQLTEKEFKESIHIGQELYICSPTTTRSLEESPSCIIDEIYQRTDNTTCHVQKNSIQSVIWKQLYTPNAWMFITENKLRIAVVCDGVREDVTLNQTGIIAISQHCIIKTKRNILTPKRTETATVLESFVRPVNINMSLVMSSTQWKPLQEEPVIEAANQLNELKNHELAIRDAVKETAWTTVHHRLIVSSTVMSTMVLVGFILGLSIWIMRKATQPKNSKQKTQDDEAESIPLEPLHVHSSTTSGEY